MKAVDFDSWVFDNEYHKMLSNIYITHVWLFDKYQEILKKYSITMQQYNVIALLNKLEVADLQTIKNMQVEKTDATRLINRLKKKGLVTSRIDPDNKRKIQVRLTAEGERLVTEISSEGPPFLDQVASKILQSEAEELNRLLRKIRS